jgi:hypothetical protein
MPLTAGTWKASGTGERELPFVSRPAGCRSREVVHLTEASDSGAFDTVDVMPAQRNRQELLDTQIG